VNNPVLDL